MIYFETTITPYVNFARSLGRNIGFARIYIGSISEWSPSNISIRGLRNSPRGWVGFDDRPRAGRSGSGSRQHPDDVGDEWRIVSPSTRGIHFLAIQVEMSGGEVLWERERWTFIHLFRLGSSSGWIRNSKIIRSEIVAGRDTGLRVGGKIGVEGTLIRSRRRIHLSRSSDRLPIVYGIKSCSRFKRSP